MLTEICAELKNWFIRNESDIHEGTFTVNGATIAPLDFLTQGQYFRIVGSVFNDGVYKYDENTLDLTAETFTGAIWAMSVPKDVVDLDGEITSWQTINGSAAVSPYNSESFGGYSYSRDGGYGWQKAFKARLNKWRKI